MVRIKILRGQAAARVRSLTSGGLGGLIVAVAIVGASMLGVGDGGSSSPAASATPLKEPAGDESVAGEKHDRQGERTAAGTGTAPAPAGRHPANLFQLPPSVRNALVFDLRDNRMHIFEAGDSDAKPVGDYFVAVGKNGIDKSREGDEKTPVGIYFVSSYIPGDTLPAIYGVGAFPITYPNAWDRRRGRTGSGIWIHGTDKDDSSLLPQSSRGCLTLRNADFMTLSQFVNIRRTPVIVSDTVEWTEPAALEAVRVSLAAAVEAWRRDWESRDTDAYFRHYARDFRTDSMNRVSWTAYKRRVNAGKTYIRIGVDEVGIYAYPGESGLFLVTFEQSYESNNFRGRKWKQQYWRREAGDWRIVHESGI